MKGIVFSLQKNISVCRVDAAILIFCEKSPADELILRQILYCSLLRFGLSIRNCDLLHLYAEFLYFFFCNSQISSDYAIVRAVLILKVFFYSFLFNILFRFFIIKVPLYVFSGSVPASLQSAR